MLRAGRLYHCDGCNGHADSHEGIIVFMRSKPALDGHYCIKVGKSHGAEVCSVECCSQPVKGQAFVFNIKFNAHPAWAGADPPRDVFFAAADDVTRQRCVQAPSFCNDWRKMGAKNLRQAGLTTEELRSIGFTCSGCKGRLNTTDRDPDTGEYISRPCFTCKGTGYWEGDA